MQYKCQICHDTGNKEKDMGGHLTCIACEAPAERMALEAFIEKLPAMGEQEMAWRIHQRALAMAPKQEADHINDVVKMVAPAGWKLVPVEPTIEMIAALGWGGDEVLAVGHGAISGGIADEYAAMLAAAPAAPAAANGALPELPEEAAGSCEVITGHETIRGMQAEIVEYHPAYSADQMRAYGQACAAAGPDAALVKALEDIIAIKDKMFGSDWQEIDEARTIARAALSGAKGN